MIVREHLDIGSEEANGRTIEQVYTRDSFVLILLSGDAYATIDADAEEDEAYINTHEGYQVKWLIYNGFDLGFIRNHRLMDESRIKLFEEQEKKAEEREREGERAEYERLKAIYERSPQ
jgi:hypothetical protein